MEEQPTESPQLPSRNKRFSKPKLKIPQINVPTINIQRHPDIHMPMSAGCAIPIANANGPFGMFQFQPSKASEYMNRHYENFKDFTRNTAKSGLSFGEKTLFWLNGRVRQLSKKWFTHIFLFLVVFLYTLAGAMLFVTVEGTHESREKANLDKELNLLMSKVRGLAMDQNILMNSELWRKNFKDLITPYENQVLESFRHGVTPDEHKTWSFWNSMFYCGTIYTTIGYDMTRFEGFNFCKAPDGMRQREEKRDYLARVSVFSRSRFFKGSRWQSVSLDDVKTLCMRTK